MQSASGKQNGDSNFQKKKTVAMLFGSNTRKLYDKKTFKENKKLFKLYLQGEPLQIVDTYKF